MNFSLNITHGICKINLRGNAYFINTASIFMGNIYFQQSHDPSLTLKQFIKKIEALRSQALNKCNPTKTGNIQPPGYLETIYNVYTDGKENPVTHRIVGKKIIPQIQDMKSDIN